MPQTYHITEDSPLLHDANCVYCHVNLALNDRVVICDECNAPHHQECWQSHENECATFGCDGGDTAVLRSISASSRESMGAQSYAELLSSRIHRSVSRGGRSSSFSIITGEVWRIAFDIIPILTIAGTVAGVIYLTRSSNISELLIFILLMIIVIFWFVAADISSKKF